MFTTQMKESTQMARKITTTTRKAASKADTLSPHALAFARLLLALRDARQAIAEVQGLDPDACEDSDAWTLILEVADGLGYGVQHGIWDLQGVETGEFLDAELEIRGITREEWVAQLQIKKGS